MNRIQKHIDALFFALIQMLLLILIGAGTTISCLLFYYMSGIFGLIILFIGFIILYISEINKELEVESWEQDHKSDGF